MKVVFHMDLADNERLGIGITNIENLHIAREDTRIHLLVNGPAVKLFTKEQTEFAERLSAIIAKGTQILLCENALRKFEIAKADIFPGALTVPAGVVALVELQHTGCAYIKP